MDSNFGGIGGVQLVQLCLSLSSTWPARCRTGRFFFFFFPPLSSALHVIVFGLILQQVMTHRVPSLYAGGLPYTATQEDVEAVFREFGPTRIEVKRGFAFVQMATQEGNDAAMSKRLECLGRRVTLEVTSLGFCVCC